MRLPHGGRIHPGEKRRDVCATRAAGLGLHNPVCQLARGRLGYAQQAGLWESGSKLPHSKTTALCHTIAFRARKVNGMRMEDRWNFNGMERGRARGWTIRPAREQPLPLLLFLLTVPKFTEAR
jgi:hypothetical protein